MIDEHDVRELLHRRANAVPAVSVDVARAVRRARRRLLANGAVAVLATAAIAVATLAGVDAIRSAPIPADDPSEELGIFAPVAGRIVYVDDESVWAVDPNGPLDTEEGPDVADDVASTLVPLQLDGEPLGWSRDGTELLFLRHTGDLIVQDILFVLHADGSETRLTHDPMTFGDSAAFTPDGRVAFIAGDGSYVVDPDGGQPERIGTVRGWSATWSPDGTRMAYLAGNGEAEVWVANADGTDAHQILADEPTVLRDITGLAWSPAGDRLAIGVGTHEPGGGSIYTFAPDGSDFTEVIVGGSRPSWSPDGSKIAYTIQCDEDPTFTCVQFDPQAGWSPPGLAIAAADGSNVRAFGFAASGPWHPGVSASEQPTPAPDDIDDGILRSDGEVLSFTGVDLVAVDPETGEERVLAEDLDDVSNARWSADGRWVAYETTLDLWVVDRTGVPRQVFDTPLGVVWTWSPTDARLAVIRGSTMYLIDATTGQTTELASIVGEVFSPVWSPDGSRILFGVRGGSVYSVDVRTGASSLFIQLPGDRLDSVDGIEWSPDGSRLLIHYDLSQSDQRLVVLNADGSDIRVLSDDVLVFGFDWSPDGLRIAFTEDHGAEFHVLVAPADGSTRSLVASLPNAPANPVWSPDGSRIALGHSNAFLSEDAPNLVIDADGSGGAAPLDDLTYESWRGGSYDCDCDLLG